MRNIILLAVLIASSILAGDAYAQTGTADSFFDRRFGDVKFIDAYFGTEDEKIEVTPGDQNVPFTVIIANIGTEDITGIKGQLSLPIGFSPTDGPDAIIEADSVTNTAAGENFALKFFVNIGEHANIGNYQASAKVEYSRLRESGLRNAFFDFDFKVTGDSIINMKATDPFLISLQKNKVVIEISNHGTAPVSGVDIELQNTQDTISSTAQSITNTENVVILDTNWDVGHIGPGEAKYFELEIYVPASVKGDTLRTPMEVTYFNAHGDRYTISRIVDFYVKGFIDTSVYNVGVIELSGKSTIIGEIINEGNENALFGFVTVEPLGSSNIRPTTQFIDEIEIESPVPFNVQVEFDGPPQYGEHDILITVRYKDDVRNEIFVTHEATVFLEDHSKDTESNADYMPLFILPAVAVAGFLGFRVYKKKTAENST